MLTETEVLPQQGTTQEPGIRLGHLFFLRTYTHMCVLMTHQSSVLINYHKFITATLTKFKILINEIFH